VVAGVITATSMDLTSSDGFTVGTGASVSSPATNVLALGTNNAERVRIDSSGNVGIGITNPSQKMHLYEPLTNSQCYLHIQNNRARNAAVKYETTQGAWYTGTGIGADQNRFTIYQDGVGDRVIVTSAGNVQIANGNLVFSTSGTGIDFSAASGSAAGSTSALLDDYEEGTFTPEFANSTGSTANISSQPATRVGAYTKIGDRVYFNLWISGNITTTETTNSIIIQGLPFDAVNGNPSYSAMSFWNFIGFSTYKDELIIRSQPNSDELVLQRYGTNLTFDDLTKTGISIMVSGHYLVA